MSGLVMSFQTVSDLVEASFFEYNIGNKWRNTSFKFY